MMNEGSVCSRRDVGDLLAICRRINALMRLICPGWQACIAFIGLSGRSGRYYPFASAPPLLARTFPARWDRRYIAGFSLTAAERDDGHDTDALALRRADAMRRSLLRCTLREVHRGA